MLVWVQGVDLPRDLVNDHDGSAVVEKRTVTSGGATSSSSRAVMNAVPMSNMISRSRGDASPGATEHNDPEMLDPEIKLQTLDSVATDFQRNYFRVPDLRASIIL